MILYPYSVSAITTKAMSRENYLNLNIHIFFPPPRPETPLTDPVSCREAERSSLPYIETVLGSGVVADKPASSVWWALIEDRPQIERQDINAPATAIYSSRSTKTAVVGAL